MKNLIKKLVSISVLSVMLLPAQFVHASTVLDAGDLLSSDFGDTTTLGDSSAQLLRNIENAESVDFSVDVDVETYTSSMNQPVKVHVDLDGISSTTQNSRSDFAGSVTDQNGVSNASSGSMILSQDTAYFSQDGKAWYFMKFASSSNYPTAAETEEAVAQMQSYLQDLFNRGVISYRFETVDFVNSKPTVRYAYTVNTDRLVEYLVEKKLIPTSEEGAARTYLAEHVTIGGSFWVDTASMLPAKLTLSVSVSQNAASYTTVGVSVLFKSFNAPVNIALPENATDIKNYSMSSGDATTLATLDTVLSNMDTDGDGLTDEKEETVWHTNPFDSDSDNDGYDDYTETRHGYDPNGPGKPDADHDGLSDSEEKYTWKTNSLLSDTDGDGYPDYTEVVNGYNPNGSGKLDTDGDGLTDYAERTIHWTSYRVADTDFDGYPDGLEIANGYDPNGPGRW